MSLSLCHFLPKRFFRSSSAFFFGSTAGLPFFGAAFFMGGFFLATTYDHVALGSGWRTANGYSPPRTFFGERTL